MPSAAASEACPEIHDISGCSENVPGNYDTGAFEDCIRDVIEAPSILYQEVLAAAPHHSAHPPSSCTTRRTIAKAQVTRARRAIAPILRQFRPHSHSTPVASSVAPTTTDTATTTIFPSSPMSTLTATTFMNSSVPVSSDAPTFTPYPYNHTHTYSQWHSRTNRLSHDHSPTLSASASHRSFSRSPTASALSSPISLTPSYTLPFPTYSSEPSSSGTPTSFVPSTSTPTPTPASTSVPTSSFPSSNETSSPFPGVVPSSPSSSYYASTPSFVATPTSAPASPSTSPSTSSQSLYVPTPTTPSSPVPITSPASSSSAVPSSQTSQCPPLQVVVNAGSVVSSSPLLPLMLTILMTAVSSSIGVLVL